MDLGTSVVTTMAGGATAGTNGVGTNAGFNWPWGISLHPNGQDLYIGDYRANLIRKVVVSTALVSTIAGSGVLAGQFSGIVDGTGTNSLFGNPAQVVVDPQGRVLYVMDFNILAVRVVNLTSFVVTTLVGRNWNVPNNNDGVGTNVQFNYPYGITIHPNGQTLYLADSACVSD